MKMVMDLLMMLVSLRMIFMVVVSEVLDFMEQVPKLLAQAIDPLGEYELEVKRIYN